MSFQERFKGKTTVMTKQGISSIIQGASKPISKSFHVSEGTTC